jgi:regulatory protein
VERLKKYTFSDALIRLRKYCAYQERCHQEVRNKMWTWGFGAEDMDRACVQLIEEGMLNEERYAKALAGGKFRTKGWGKKKIVVALKQKGISEYLVKTSMKEIEDSEYEKKLLALLQKKQKTLAGERPLTRKQKLARFGIGKGYEPELVWKVVAAITASEN